MFQKTHFKRVTVRTDMWLPENFPEAEAVRVIHVAAANLQEKWAIPELKIPDTETEQVVRIDDVEDLDDDGLAI